MATFIDTLSGTWLSAALGEALWAVPLIQSVHILAIAALMGATLLVNLRLAGAMGADAPLAAFRQKFMPVIWSGLAILLVTGFLLILSEPDRALLNQIFWLKMALLAAVLAITAIQQVALRQIGAAGASVPAIPVPLRLAAVLALALWTAIILSGRWIAYS